jgi:hypothetical protein
LVSVITERCCCITDDKDNVSGFLCWDFGSDEANERFKGKQTTWSETGGGGEDGVEEEEEEEGNDDNEDDNDVVVVVVSVSYTEM